MLAEGSGYTPLPGETTLYQSPPRTTLSLQSPSRNTPAEAYSLQCKSGVIYLTNRRIIYLPVSPTPTFTSFAVPILNVSDSRVTAPWFGANKWEAAITPVYNGGIPASHSALELVMEFKEGGAFDFATTFERLRERLRHAVDVAASVGSAGDGVEGDGRGGGALAGVNLSGVHLEDLPAYEERGASVRVPDNLPSPPLGRGSVGTQGTGSTANRSSPMGSPRQEGFQEPPSEPPPGYEEVQRGGVADELERRLRGSV
ncbi:ww-domain ligand protein [Paraphaeosphaeria sporulosa]